MKKIIIFIIAFFLFAPILVQADRISVGFEAELQRLEKLPKEQRLEMCKELGVLNVATKHKWLALKCDELLKEESAKNKQADSVPAPEEKQDIRAYGLAGGLVVLLFGSALILLLRTRKTMKLLPAITFLMLFGGMSAWADLIAPGREFKPTPPPQIHCTDEYCVARAAPQEKFSYKILYIGLGAGILVIGGASFVLLRKKRKK